MYQHNIANNNIIETNRFTTSFTQRLYISHSPDGAEVKQQLSSEVYLAVPELNLCVNALNE